MKSELRELTLAGKTLNQVLAHFGYTSERVDFSRKKILKKGQVVFEGAGAQVWEWVEKNHGNTEVCGWGK